MSKQLKPNNLKPNARYETDDWVFQLYITEDGEKNIRLLDYTGADRKNVYIPSEICELPVRSIYDYALLGVEDTATSIVFDKKSSIESIPENFCSNFKYLKDVQLPESIINIGAWAFSRCENLTTVNTPHNLQYIQKNAFYGCKELTQLPISDKIKEIHDEAFYNCLWQENSKHAFNTVKIVFPESLEVIGKSAFENSGIVSADFSHTKLTKLPDNIFANCWTLFSVTLPSNITQLGHQVFYNCKILCGVHNTENIESISDFAFSNCENLSKLNLRSLKNADPSSFDQCPNLTIKVSPSSRDVILSKTIFPESQLVGGNSRLKAILHDDIDER